MKLKTVKLKTVKIKPTRGWCIISNMGWITYGIHSTRKEAIEQWIKDWGNTFGTTDWNVAKKRASAKAIQVLITAVKPELPWWK